MAVIVSYKNGRRSFHEEKEKGMGEGGKGSGRYRERKAGEGAIKISEELLSLRPVLLMLAQ